MAEVRPVDLTSEGLGGLAAFLRSVFPSARHVTAEYLDWMYNRNPVRPAVGADAWEGGERVGHVGCQPFRVTLDGEEERGLLLLNVAARPTHRGTGTYRAMAERCGEWGAEAGYGFTLGIANDRSASALVRMLGYQDFGPLDARIGPGRPPPPDPHGGGPIRFARRWSDEELRWRLACPGRRYTTSGHGSRAAVLAPTAFPGITAELGVFDAGRLPGDLPPGRSGPLSVFIGLDPRRSWRRRLFVDLPVRLRPAPLRVVFQDLRARGRRLERNHVLFRALDFDAY